MVLAIDLDNTLFDTAREMRRIWDNNCGAIVGGKKLTFGRRNEARYDWGSPDGMAFVLDYIERYKFLGYLEPYERAVDTIQLLHLAGHTLHFLSDRPFRQWDATIASFARCKLADENPADRGNDYGTLWLCGGDKVAFLADLRATERVDTLVDDDPAALRAAADLGLRAVVYDQPWNTRLPYPRVRGWKGSGGLAELLGVTFKEGIPRASEQGMLLP